MMKLGGCGSVGYYRVVLELFSNMLERNDLIEMLACPDCKAGLNSISGCDECGILFQMANDTPSLFPQKANRTVSFQFTPDRSTAGDAFRKALSYPKRRGASGADGPYHLDLAHLDILESLPVNSTILEIGCGGGQMRDWMTKKGHRYLGTDISSSRIDDSLKSHGGPDILCDAHFLPFRDQTFDLVYSAAVTEHLACPFLVAQEVSRVLRPGGYYLGNVSFLEPWHDDSFFHMTPLGVYENLTQADFEAKHIWPGQGYSGFRAIMRMGNKVTKPLTFLGDSAYLAYRLGNKLRNFARRRPDWLIDRIEDAARVSGATDWIAQKRRPE
jgi:SAM-dependent methyltransferase